MCSNAVQLQSKLTNLFKRNKDPGQNLVAQYEERSATRPQIVAMIEIDQRLTDATPQLVDTDGIYIRRSEQRSMLIQFQPALGKTGCPASQWCAPAFGSYPGHSSTTRRIRAHRKRAIYLAARYGADGT
jgi:hypothetical protein